MDVTTDCTCFSMVCSSHISCVWNVSIFTAADYSLNLKSYVRRYCTLFSRRLYCAMNFFHCCSIHIWAGWNLFWLAHSNSWTSSSKGLGALCYSHANGLYIVLMQKLSVLGTWPGRDKKSWEKYCQEAWNPGGKSEDSNTAHSIQEHGNLIIPIPVWWPAGQQNLSRSTAL